MELGQTVKRAVEKDGMLGWQFNTVGVSDGITMGGEGACFALPAARLQSVHIHVYGVLLSRRADI